MQYRVQKQRRFVIDCIGGITPGERLCNAVDHILTTPTYLISLLLIYAYAVECLVL